MMVPSGKSTRRLVYEVLRDVFAAVALIALFFTLLMWATS